MQTAFLPNNDSALTYKTLLVLSGFRRNGYAKFLLKRENAIVNAKLFNC